MIVLHTENIFSELEDHPPEVAFWAYNGFDCLLPHEILSQIKPQMSPNQKAVYDFERALLPVALRMSLTGTSVNMTEVDTQALNLSKIYDELEHYITRLALATWAKGLNPRSPAQMIEFFYKDPDGFQVPPKYAKKGGRKSSVTCDREALEAIHAEHYYCKPIINAILAQKDAKALLNFYRRGIDSDSRVRCSFGVASTETGRWSSYSSPWGRGGNFQNQTESVRKIYQPDPEFIFGYPDLPQAESRGVAYYSGDSAYIEAVESGDLHTLVARMVWPELDWTDDLKADRDIAERPFYRWFTYRDMAKRGGHGTNYLGTPQTMARHLKVSAELMAEFQSRYFNAFPGIRNWHHEIQVQLESSGKLTTALGRERTFFGRLNDAKTLREAVAFLPQSLISDMLKIGALRLHVNFPDDRRIKLHADMHDGLLISMLARLLDELAPKVKALLTVSVKFPSGVLSMVPDLDVGWYWQKKLMKKWAPGILAKLGPCPDHDYDYLDMPVGSFTESKPLA